MALATVIAPGHPVKQPVDRPGRTVPEFATIDRMDGAHPFRDHRNRLPQARQRGNSSLEAPSYRVISCGRPLVGLRLDHRSTPRPPLRRPSRSTDVSTVEQSRNLVTAIPGPSRRRCDQTPDRACPAPSASPCRVPVSGLRWIIEDVDGNWLIDLGSGIVSDYHRKLLAAGRRRGPRAGGGLHAY